MTAFTIGHAPDCASNGKEEWSGSTWDKDPDNFWECDDCGGIIPATEGGGSVISYSNPRREAVIDDWPFGSHRTRATFQIEAKAGRGERATRITVNPKTGKPAAAKKLTFAMKARIVDGDDGRTYLAMLTNYGHISIMKGDMQFSQETIHKTTDTGDPNARYDVVRALFND